MALTDLTPVTRMESIFNGDDIEPVTREEYFIRKAASGGGGGSSLPSYTSSDVGKVLKLGEVQGQTQTVTVIPEQTVEFAGERNVPLSDTDAYCNIEDDTEVTYIINGTPYVVAKQRATYIWVTNPGVFYVIAIGKKSAVSFGAYNNNVPGHEGDDTPVPGTYTVSATAVTTVSTVAPVWETVSKLEYDAVLQLTYDEQTSSYVADKTFEEESALESGVTLVQYMKDGEPGYSVVCNREKILGMPENVVTDVIYTSKHIVLQLDGATAVRFYYTNIDYKSTGITDNTETKYIALVTD